MALKIVRRKHVDDSQLAPYIPDPLLRQILASRGIRRREDIDCDIKELLHYRDLKDIDRASKLLADAIEKGERILVAGDYDVDGITGTAVGVRGLKALGAMMVDYFVPSRYDGGYGLSVNVVEKYAELGVSLILTVDNGISCNEAIARAKELGLTVVVTDHHETLNELPAADAIVDPKRKDDLFESKALCGASVCFYLLIAVRAELSSRNYFKKRNLKRPDIANLLDLVAIGTVGDVVPFDTNNRRLIKAGIRRIRKGVCQVGIFALIEFCKLRLSTFDVQNISFDLCPRLNAAGRIKIEGNPAMDLLLCDDSSRAYELAKRLDFCNRRRGDFERVSVEEAQKDAQKQKDRAALTLYRSSWISGVAGLIAGRIKNQFNAPCFVFSGEGDVISGSARSVPGFSLAEILQEIDSKAPGVLLRFGGHAMAAGASIKKENIEYFGSLFDSAARNHISEASDQETVTDGELPSDHLCVAFARDLETLGPWGEGFPAPVFDGEFTISEIYTVANRHLRFALSKDDGNVMNAIKFRATINEKALMKGLKVRVLYSVGVDRYYQNDRLEVRIENIEPI